jgi:oligosaccharide repeat unit polymerase
MGAFKNILLTTDVQNVKTNLNIYSIKSIRKIPLLIFGSEFRTASENLLRLVEWVPHSFEYFKGQAIWNDLSSVIKIGFLHSRDSSPSPAYWFTKVFYTSLYSKGGGVGFTLVGLGYLDFGILGVIVLFAALGKITGVIYRLSGKNIVWLIFYFNLIPLTMYAIRGSLASILSPAIKHVILPIIIIFCIGMMGHVASRYRVNKRNWKESLS